MDDYDYDDTGNYPEKRDKLSEESGYAELSNNTFLNTPSIDIAEVKTESKQTETDEDKYLLELVEKLQSFMPIVPDELSGYFMNKAGLGTEDKLMMRLIALISQRYITNIAEGALQYSKRNPVSSKKKEKKHILTTEDLIASLSDHGIQLRKPQYYR